MDIDAYTAGRAEDWSRLAQLNRKRRLSGAEIDELMGLYHRASADLATITSVPTDPDVVLDLTNLVSMARGRIGGTRRTFRESVGGFFTVTLPLALYRIWPVFLVLTALSLITAVFTGFWVYTHPETLLAQQSEMELRQYAEDSFKAYYSNYPAPDFAAQVWTNNATIAVLMVALFFTGAYPVYLLLTNFANVGVAGAIMAKYGDLGIFFGLITPHGLLELSCIVLACAAALRLFWALFVPGEDPRMVSLARAGRQFGPVAAGLIILLGISGLEEAFLTPSALLTPVKIAVAAVVYVALVTWVVFFGRRALRAGLSGDLEESAAGYVD